jgi:hypothetical protein
VEKRFACLSRTNERQHRESGNVLQVEIRDSGQDRRQTTAVPLGGELCGRQNSE